MTVSTHVYTAALIGSPDLPLSLRGGSVTLDAGGAPHVTADLVIAGPGQWAAGPVWVPAPATLAALDPRLTKRVRITAVVTYTGFGSVTRTFNLGLRDRSVPQSDGTVRLSLASDEALLDDYSPLTEDVGAYTYQSSLRAVVNYALGKAIPGAALEPGSADPPIRALIASRNLIIDPGTAASAGGGYSGTNVSVDFNDTSWSISGDGDSYNLLTPTASDSYLSVGPAGGMAFGVQAERTYVFSATGNVKTALSGTVLGADAADAGGGANLSRVRGISVYSRIGAGPISIWHSPQVPNVINTPTRVAVKFTLPAGTTEVFLRAYHGTTAGAIRWDGFRLSEATADPTDTGYWDGDTADTSEYNYAWTGTADASVSTRTPLIDRAADLLTWKVGTSALAFLAPIVQAFGLRLVCDEQRKWTLRSESYTAPGALAIRHGVNLIDGTDTISRGAGIWFDARATRYTWLDQDGNPQERIDAYALSGSYTLLTTLDIDAPYPGPGRSEYAVRRAQGRGREVTATAVADWTAAAEQPITVVLDGAPIQVGITQSVVFDLDRDEMTVTTRATDTPVGAIDLLTGTIDSLVGTIDSL